MFPCNQRPPGVFPCLLLPAPLLPPRPPINQGRGMELLANGRERNGEGWGLLEGRACRRQGQGPPGPHWDPPVPPISPHMGPTAVPAAQPPGHLPLHRSHGSRAAGGALQAMLVVTSCHPCHPPWPLFPEKVHSHASLPGPGGGGVTPASSAPCPVIHLPLSRVGWQSRQSETSATAQAAEPGGEGQVRCPQGQGAFSCCILGAVLAERLSDLSLLRWLHPGGFLGSVAPSRLLPVSSGPATPTLCFEN